jgi:uncharacterized membrane protein
MLSEWANLLLRWIHVFTAMLWIGQTWLFMWLDHRFHDPEENPGGKVYMVHSGGFYVVEKRPALDAMPKTLHWFKWEAAITWASGLLLLVVVYYHGGLLLGPDAPLSEGRAIALGVGVLFGGWPLYDQGLCRILSRWPAAGALACLAAIVGLGFGLGHVFSARAAFIHVGAVMGTLMANNVWARIIPGQRAMVAAIAAGRPPDLALGQRAKERSSHNTFIVVPLVLIMLSNHFPTATYGQRYPWAALGALVVLGWAAAAVVRRR